MVVLFDELDISSEILLEVFVEHDVKAMAITKQDLIKKAFLAVNLLKVLKVKIFLLIVVLHDHYKENEKKVF